jgi:hypothetical protein
MRSLIAPDYVAHNKICMRDITKPGAIKDWIRIRLCKDPDYTQMAENGVVGGVLENGPHDEPLHISNYVCESSVT